MVLESPIIEVLSRNEAGDVLCSLEAPANITYLISIGDGFDELPTGYERVARKIRLLIADVVTEFGATDGDVQKIITLARELHSARGTILIHCEAGISRSSAAALIMYACWLGPGREREAMKLVLERRPIAIPNRRMVRIADRLLEREGQLVAALLEDA